MVDMTVLRTSVMQLKCQQLCSNVVMLVIVSSVQASVVPCSSGGDPDHSFNRKCPCANSSCHFARVVIEIIDIYTSLFLLVHVGMHGFSLFRVLTEEC